MFLYLRACSKLSHDQFFYTDLHTPKLTNEMNFPHQATPVIRVINL